MPRKRGKSIVLPPSKSGNKYPEPKRKWSSTVEDEMKWRLEDVWVRVIESPNTAQLLVNQPGRKVDRRIPRGTTMSMLTERIKD